jgi:hypothetical protein
MANPDSQPPRRPLPPHLQFLSTMGNFAGMDDEELIVHVRDIIAKIKLHRQEITAHGIDPDHMLNSYVPLLAQFEKTVVVVEAANEATLQAAADLADHKYQAFKASQDLLRRMEETAPFDPQTENLRELVGEMAKHVPKE